MASADRSAADEPIDLTAGGVDDRRLATIRSLLAKAEATEFPEEAEAFFNKASELIARFAIDEAVLWASSPSSREQPDEIRLVVHSPYVTQKAVLVGRVAGAHGCRAIRFGSGSASGGEVVAVVGFPTDLRWVETLVTSLLIQLTAAMLAGSPPGMSSAQSAGWRRSFIIGFSEEVGTRLQADREVAARTADDRVAAGRRGDHPPHSVSLALVERSEEVRDEFRKRFPHTQTTRASTGGSRSGHHAGRAAGRDAALGRDSVVSHRSLPRGG